MKDPNKDPVEILPRIFARSWSNPWRSWRILKKIFVRSFKRFPIDLSRIFKDPSKDPRIFARSSFIPWRSWRILTKIFARSFRRFLKRSSLNPQGSQQRSLKDLYSEDLWISLKDLCRVFERFLSLRIFGRSLKISKNPQRSCQDFTRELDYVLWLSHLVLFYKLVLQRTFGHFAEICYNKMYTFYRYFVYFSMAFCVVYLCRLY